MKDSTVQYCVGCSICESCSKAELKTNSKGFAYPVSGDQQWLDMVCPIGNLPAEFYEGKSIWGRREGVYFGWSKNCELRNNASSGGMISEIASFLLNEGIVDGIIHICANPDRQTENITTISYNSEEVKSKCGSRYSISHPLDILKELDAKKKYAFIGKPCDVVALRNYQNIVPENKKLIPVLLSFFCMGLPSVDAQKKLLMALNSNEEHCQALTYRGNGWPGYATVINKDGTSKGIDYDTSWGRILGRDVMPACRFCMDGIGEAADISCGDAWYINQNETPDFSEHDGRNVVFARDALGLSILQKMEKCKVVILEEISDPEPYLSRVQKSQFFRRASMKSRIAALGIMHKAIPVYPKEMLNAFSRNISIKERIRVFLGTCKRISKGAI